MFEISFKKVIVLRSNICINIVSNFSVLNCQIPKIPLQSHLHHHHIHYLHNLMMISPAAYCQCHIRLFGSLIEIWLSMRWGFAVQRARSVCQSYLNRTNQVEAGPIFFVYTEFHTFFSRQVPISSDIHIVRTFPDMSGARPSCQSWPDCSLRPFP